MKFGKYTLRNKPKNSWQFSHDQEKKMASQNIMSGFPKVKNIKTNKQTNKKVS